MEAIEKLGEMFQGKDNNINALKPKIMHVFNEIFLQDNGRVEIRCKKTSKDNEMISNCFRKIY